MKRCPTCQRTFEDDSLTYCLDDGTPLVSEASSDSEPTLVSPSPGGRELQPTQYEQLPGKATVTASGYEPSLVSSFGAAPKRRVWPWVVAGLGVLFFFALVIIAVIAIPQIAKKTGNSNEPVVVKSPPAPSETSTPGPEESTSETEAPTDEDVVLSQLTELEKQWTDANIKGDKNAIDRILAEEYSSDESPRNKQEYLKALKPDPTVQSWELQDLHLDLNGERATMDGYLREQTTAGVQVYSFTDEFLWRDGRWQAVGSRATRVK